MIQHDSVVMTIGDASKLVTSVTPPMVLIKTKYLEKKGPIWWLFVLHLEKELMHSLWTFHVAERQDQGMDQ